MNKRLLLFISIVFTIYSCDLLIPPEPSSEGNETPEIVEPVLNTVAQDFVEDFDEGLSTSNSLDESQRSALKTVVLSSAAGIINSEDLTVIIPGIVGLYIENLSIFTTLNTASRLNAVEAISATSIAILNGNEALINSSTTRAITADKDTLLFILENISKAIVKNVPKSGFSVSTYAEATERTVKSLVGSLDEGGLAEDTISEAAQFITMSAVTQLSESVEYENIIGDAVQSIAKGATEGVADISIPEYTQADIAPLLESVTKGAVEGLGSIATSEENFKLILPMLTEGSTEGLSIIKVELGATLNNSTINDAIQSIAQGATAAIADVAIIENTDDLITLISESVSESSMINIQGITQDDVSSAVISGVAEGAQQISNYDATELGDLIVINDETGTEQVVDGADAIISDGVDSGQADIPADETAIRAVLDAIIESLWWDADPVNTTQVANFITDLDSVITTYPGSDLGEVYDAAAWLTMEGIWDLSETEGLIRARDVEDYAIPAAYDYDTGSLYAFYALDKLAKLERHFYNSNANSIDLYNEILDRFPNDQWKRLHANQKILDIYEDIVWNEYDDFSNQRTGYINETFLPLALSITPENYPDLDPGEWQFYDVLWKLSGVYQHLEMYNEAVVILNQLDASEDISDYDIQNNLGNLFGDKANRLWNDYGDFSGAVAASTDAITAFASLDIDAVVIADDRGQMDVARYWRDYGKVHYNLAQFYFEYNDYNNTTDSNTHFDYALNMFIGITPVYYSEIVDEDDLWIFENVFDKALRIYSMTDRSADAIDLVQSKIDEGGLSNLETAKLYKNLGDIYRTTSWNIDWEGIDPNGVKLTAINNAIDNYILAESMLYNGGAILDNDNYGHVASELLYTFEDHIWTSSNVAEDNETWLTTSEVLTHVDIAEDVSPRLRTLNDDNRFIQSYGALGGYYRACAEVINREEDETNFITYSELAISTLLEGVTILPNYEVNNWIGSRIKENIFWAYNTAGELDNAEERLADVLADPNVEAESKAETLRGMARAYMGSLYFLFDNDENITPLPSEVDSTAFSVEYYSEALRDLYSDIEDGRFKFDAAELLGNLYFEMYYYQKTQEDETPENIADTKSLAIENYEILDVAWGDDWIQERITELEKSDFYDVRDLVDSYINQAHDLWNDGDDSNDYEIIGLLTDAKDELDSIIIAEDIITYDLDKFDESGYWDRLANINKWLGDRYNYHEDNPSAAEAYYEEAKTIFLTITKDAYPDVYIDDNSMFENSMSAVADIYRNLGQQSAAITFIDGKLDDSTLTNSEYAMLYRNLGDIYNDQMWSFENQTERLSALSSAVENYKQAETLYYNGGAFFDEWAYSHTVSSLSSLITEKLRMSNEDYTNGVITFTQLIADETDMETWASQVLELDSGQNSILSYPYLGNYYLNVAYVIGSDHEYYGAYTQQAVDTLDISYGLLSTPDLDDWLVQEIKTILFNSYIANNEAVNAETLLAEMLTDDMIEESSRGDSLLSMSHYYRNLMLSTDSGSDTSEVITPLFEDSLGHVMTLYNDYYDIDDRNFDEDSTNQLGNLYYNYYYYLVGWGDDTATSKASALIYLQENYDITGDGDILNMINDLNGV